MLRQVYILKKGNIIYEKDFGRVLTFENFQSIFKEVEAEVSRGLLDDFGSTHFFKYRIIYTVDSELDLLFIFIIGFNDDLETVKRELKKLKTEFLVSFGDIIDNLDPSLLEIFDPLIESIHKKIRTKISLVGFSGVGKTTITKLISAGEIPDTHIPTITGKVSTIKIGKLVFHLWDFAGQEQFSYLWSDFIYGSDAVLLITDSTLENVEKSRYFVELIKEQTPNAHSAAIANKQDLDNALSVEKIEEILGIKAYSMIAIEPGNRDKMIQIVADILEMNTEESTLLKPLFERDKLIQLAKQSLENGDLAESVQYFDKIADLCLKLGDDALYREFYDKAQKFKRYLH
ncbi:MAG: GTP-binding protein [Candidatus Lokiarchaeota archaeon]|nr:GTP-binding protein [Candidatus Lokiarchaeota archaeon]